MVATFFAGFFPVPTALALCTARVSERQALRFIALFFQMSTSSSLFKGFTDGWMEQIVHGVYCNGSIPPII